jgi:hypothetical protein
MATPRNLDPKFSDEAEDPTPAEPSGGNIVFRQNVTNSDGTVGEKVHGPMPVSEWPAYEKEHGL